MKMEHRNIFEEYKQSFKEGKTCNITSFYEITLVEPIYLDEYCSEHLEFGYDNHDKKFCCMYFRNMRCAEDRDYGDVIESDTLEGLVVRILAEYSSSLGKFYITDAIEFLDKEFQKKGE